MKSIAWINTHIHLNVWDIITNPYLLQMRFYLNRRCIYGMGDKHTQYKLIELIT